MNKNLTVKCVTCIFYKLCNSAPVPHCEDKAYYQVDTIKTNK